jgi:hypothetical protein
MTKVLGKDDLLSGATLRRELVPIPELDASIWMREMSGDHALAFKRHIDQLKADGKKETTVEQDVEIMTMVISFSACDEDGSLLFGSPEEARQLTVNNINLLMDLGNKALALSRVNVNGAGLTSEVADDLPNAPTSSSSGDLPRSSAKRARK